MPSQPSVKMQHSTSVMPEPMKHENREESACRSKLSASSTSLVNLDMVRPDGVVSNHHIGAFITAFRSPACSLDAALTAPLDRVS